jgi:hypothetical protein
VRAYSKMEVKNHWDVLAGIDDAWAALDNVKTILELLPIY